MTLKNITDVEEFLKTADSCEGGVYLTSQYGDKYNLKSKLTQFVAVGALLQSDNELELFCDEKTDEKKFYQFFQDCPEVLH